MFFLLKEENFLIFLKTNQLFCLILVTTKEISRFTWLIQHANSRQIFYARKGGQRINKNAT